MLTDPTEIRIIANARQKNVRDPNRSRDHFTMIFRDFLAEVDFSGRYLDMGPGQYDFCELARARGGVCVGMDFDPPVIELGKYKGFETIEMNIQEIPSANLSYLFDGVFNKFTLNAFWFANQPEKHEAFIDALCDMMKPGGWAWLAPWNGIPQSAGLTDDQISSILELQKSLLEARGFVTHEISREESLLYGIHGTVANNRIFTKNLHRKAVQQ